MALRSLPAVVFLAGMPVRVTLSNPGRRAAEGRPKQARTPSKRKHEPCALGGQSLHGHHSVHRSSTPLNPHLTKETILLLRRHHSSNLSPAEEEEEQGFEVAWLAQPRRPALVRWAEGGREGGRWRLVSSGPSHSTAHTPPHSWPPDSAFTAATCTHSSLRVLAPDLPDTRTDAREEASI